MSAGRAFYSMAQGLLQDGLPIACISYQSLVHAVAKRVTGFQAHPDGMIRLRGVAFAK